MTEVETEEEPMIRASGPTGEGGLDEPPRRDVRTVAICTLTVAEWQEVTGWVLHEVERHEAFQWVKHKDGGGSPLSDIVSTLGVRGVGPDWAILRHRLRGQERRLKWVCLQNSRMWGHTFRGVTWSGVYRSEGWRTGARGPERQNRDYAEKMIAVGHWDGLREAEGWNGEGKDMTLKQVAEWLGLF